MIQRREKLHNIEGQSTYHNIFNLPYTDEVSKSNSSIRCQFMFESTQLTLIDEVV